MSVSHFIDWQGIECRRGAEEGREDNLDAEEEGGTSNDTNQQSEIGTGSTVTKEQTSNGRPSASGRYVV